MRTIYYDTALLYALREDIGEGDMTTESCVPADRQARGSFLAREGGVLCGLDIARRVFALLDTTVSIVSDFIDGKCFTAGDTLGVITGPARAILNGERTALNLLQRLSAIATATAEAVEMVRGTRAHITDTRKTTPGLRALEKYAVRTGGACNHRFNLADGVLIKDNHIAAAGGIEKAVNAARDRAPHMMKIEVEVTNMEQVREALRAGADIIMLDNMDDDTMREAVREIGDQALTEASGNMGARDLASVAATGVDLISIGALTHSVRALDISLVFDKLDNH